MEICEYNDAVRCAGKVCERCGWNPAVEARRKHVPPAGMMFNATVMVDIYDETRQKVVGSIPWPVLGEMSDQYF